MPKAGLYIAMIMVTFISGIAFGYLVRDKGRFSLRHLLIGMTVLAVLLGAISAFY